MKVVCWKWEPQGPKRERVAYTAKHVNNLAAMLDRHLKMPHEVVCITDNGEGIDGSVRVVPLWDDLRQFGMCWTRLKVFSGEMADVIGSRFVSIDLDCVIAGEMDSILDTPEPFKIWKNIGGGAFYCGSMFLMDAGARSAVWRKFDWRDLRYMPAPKRLKRKSARFIHPAAYNSGMIIGSDQAWISYILGKGQPVWTEADGVFSYTHGCLACDKLGRPRVTDVPSNVKIVFFHGVGDPSLPETQKRYPWIMEHWG